MYRGRVGSERSNSHASCCRERCPICHLTRWRASGDARHGVARVVSSKTLLLVSLVIVRDLRSSLARICFPNYKREVSRGNLRKPIHFNHLRSLLWLVNRGLRAFGFRPYPSPIFTLTRSPHTGGFVELKISLSYQLTVMCGLAIMCLEEQD